MTLQNATATFSQSAGTFTPDKAINGTEADNSGWAINENIQNHTAVFETKTNVGVEKATILSFQLRFSHYSPAPAFAHPLGRFRLSATTDSRNAFADGLSTGGDVTANWTVLEAIGLKTESGALLRKLDDGSILASGTLHYIDAYTITAVSPLTGITGFRLEAIEDPSLPFDGPGREPMNGNFVVSEFIVSEHLDETRLMPRILTHPQSQEVSLGGTASFSVSCENPDNLSYQWLFNGEGILRQTNATLVLPGVQLSHGGVYAVRVSNQNGSVTSDGAVLSVKIANEERIVTLQNATATFSQSAGAFTPDNAINGTEADNSGWAINENIQNHTAVFETKTNVGVEKATILSFQLRFSHFSPAPAFAHPLGRFRLSATTDSRDAFADGLFTGGDVTANWTVLEAIGLKTESGALLRKLDDGSILASGTLNYIDAYTITVVSPLTGITGFRLEAIEDPSLPFDGPGREPMNGNFVVSEFIVSEHLDETRLMPRILTHPRSQEVPPGGTVSFSVSGENPGQLSYQWLFNGEGLPAETNATLVLTGVQLSHEGTYTVRVSNQNGSVTSDGAVLHVKTVAIWGEVQFSNRTSTVNAPITDAYGARLSGANYLAQIYAGTSLEFLTPIGPAVPFGTGESAGFFADGVRVIPGISPGSSAVLNLRIWESAAGASYESAAASKGGHGLSEVLNVTLGGGNIPPAELTGLRSFALFGKPRIFRQPAGLSTNDHADILISVQAAGTMPLSYQWRKDGMPLANGAETSLILSNASVLDSGAYTVTVSNRFGSITSDSAILIVRNLDRQPPTVVLTSPISETTTFDRVVLSGQVTDNVGVTLVEWERNGQPGGLLVLADGTFSVPVTLSRGANRIVVRAFDADGNQSTAEANVTLDASRDVFISTLSAVPEGSRLKVPIMLRSKGEISAVTLQINYPANYLAEPEFQWAHNSPGILSTINTNIAGQVRASIALAGTTLPAGTNALATLTFRVRSIPGNLSVPLALLVPGLYAVNGEPITTGTDVTGGSVQLIKRRYVGDNNANDMLDVGDASIMMRLITLLEPLRQWDVPANDLNRNSQLDAGDVIRVLRTVVNLDPQPGAPVQTLSLARQSATSTSETVTLSADKLRVNVGERVKARVQLTGRTDTLSGASFTLNFPTNALWLENAESIRLGSIVPSGSLSIWNLEPGQTNFSAQSGKIHFGVSSGSPWLSNNGEIVEIAFSVKEGAVNSFRLPISINAIHLTDGWNLDRSADTELILTSRDPISASISQATLLADGTFKLGGSGEPGLRYAIETSIDLLTWSEIGIAAVELGTFSFIDNDAKSASHRYYRVNQLE